MAHGGLLVLIIFVLLLCASGLGMYLHDRLGERHRTSETKDHVRLVVSILVTFTALVLSLMLSEVKGTFDTFDARLRSFAGDLSNLDIHLREYGPDAEPIRATIRKYVAAAIADSWRNEPAPSGDFPRFDGPGGVERPELGALLIQADTAIHKLDPPDHFRQRLTDSLSNQIDEALRARRQLLETSHDTISWPLMVGNVRVVGGRFRSFRASLAAQRGRLFVDRDLRDLRRLRHLPDRRFQFSDRRAIKRPERFHAGDLGQNGRALKTPAEFFARLPGINRTPPESPPLNGAFRRRRGNSNVTRSRRRVRPPANLEMHAVGRNRRGLDGRRRRALIAADRLGESGGKRLFLRPDLRQPHRLRQARQSRTRASRSTRRSTRSWRCRTSRRS